MNNKMTQNEIDKTRSTKAVTLIMGIKVVYPINQVPSSIASACDEVERKHTEFLESMHALKDTLHKSGDKSAIAAWNENYHYDR